MKITNYLTTFVTAFLVITSAVAQEGSDIELTAEEVMMKSHLAYYYAANDGVADLKMEITNKKGKTRVREFTMLRFDEEDGGKQYYYTYFRKPSDVSRMTFMVHKNPNANDARWIYIPSVDLIKPISADDKNSSFVNSDFSYEDVSGRHPSEDNHSFSATSRFVIESIPKEKYKGFAKKITYIDSTNFLPLKEEFFNDKDVMIKQFTALKIEEIEGFPTITERRMDNLKKKQYTIVTLGNITYNQGLSKKLFTERYLKNPSRKYIK